MVDDQQESSEGAESKKKGLVDFQFNPLKKRFLRKTNFQKLVQKLRKQQARIRSAANKLADDLIEKEQSMKLEFKPLRQKKNKSARKKKKISKMLSGKMSQLINTLRMTGPKDSGKK